MKRTIVITGTDTGAGKTILTALLLARLQSRGERVTACKPFSSGTRTDGRLLASLQKGKHPLARINPFHFRAALAPQVAAAIEGVKVSQASVLRHLKALQAGCDFLLIEGAGGLLAPLGPGYSLLTLIEKLDAEVVIAASNRLGVLNHVLLTARALQSVSHPSAAVVLTPPEIRDASARWNERTLRECLPGRLVLSLPRLRGNLASANTIRRHAGRLARPLDRIISSSARPPAKQSERA